MARYTGTTAQRGYGWQHQQLRARLLAQWRQGDPCARCGRPMWDKQRIDLGHTDDRAAYTGLEHRACNRRDGQRKTSAILRTKGYQLTARQRTAIRVKAKAQANRRQTLPARPAIGMVAMANRRQPSRW